MKRVLFSIHFHTAAGRAPLSLFSGTQAEKVGNPKKDFENCIRTGKKPPPNTMP
jgi:hypothetical protein